MTSVPQWPMPALQVDWAQIQGTQRSGSWEERSWGFPPVIRLTPDLGSVTPRNSDLHNPLKPSKLFTAAVGNKCSEIQAMWMQSQNNHAECRKPDKDRHMTSGSIYIKLQLICRDKMIRVCWGLWGWGGSSMKYGELKMSALCHGTYPRMSQVSKSQYVRFPVDNQATRVAVINTCCKQGMGTKHG